MADASTVESKAALLQDLNDATVKQSINSIVAPNSAGITAAGLQDATNIQTINQMVIDNSLPIVTAGLQTINPTLTIEFTNQTLASLGTVDGLSSISSALFGGASQAASIQSFASLGAGYEPTIASVVTMRVTIDAGSDIDHPEIFLTPNASDIAVASQRLANADTTVSVIKTALTGATANGATYDLSLPNGLMDVFVGLRGGTSYTLSAGAVATTTTAVKAAWSVNTLKWCRITIGGPYIGGGSNKRYRDMIITGYSGV